MMLPPSGSVTRTTTFVATSPSFCRLASMIDSSFGSRAAGGASRAEARKLGSPATSTTWRAVSFSTGPLSGVVVLTVAVATYDPVPGSATCTAAPA